MPQLILSEQEYQLYLKDGISPKQLVDEAIYQGIVPQNHLHKSINMLHTTMFAIWRSLEMPQELLDNIANNDTLAFKEATDYIIAREDDVEVKTMKINALSLAIQSIAIASLLGLQLIQDDKTQGEVAPIKRKKPKGFDN